MGPMKVEIHRSAVSADGLHTKSIMSNNPMIVTNFLIFTDRQSDKIETQARNTNSGPTWFQHVVTILGARTIWHQNIKRMQFWTKKTNELFGAIDKKQFGTYCTE